MEEDVESITYICSYESGHAYVGWCRKDRVSHVKDRADPKCTTQSRCHLQVCTSRWEALHTYTPFDSTPQCHAYEMPH